MQTIIKKTAVRMDASPVRRAPRPGTGDAVCAEKSVELAHEGELVRAIQVTCSCGEVTVIELDYPEPEPAR